MFKYLNPRRFYHAVGKKHFWEFIILAVFLLFFYGPLINMFMLAFADTYEVPAVLPQEWGFKWWKFVLEQKSLRSSILQSYGVAIITTICSMVLCIPAAYSIARFKFPGRKLFMLSFLLTNAFPKLGIYTSIGILFYRYNLMGTLIGVVIIHMINSMMFMVWLPAVATLYTFLGSMEEAQGTMLVGLARIKTMPVEMYGIILDYPGQAGAVFSILLIIPSIILIFAMRKYIGPEAIAGGFKMK